MTPGRPRLAAHRGGAALWPENSLRAFANAIALGCDLVEFDVHSTADGQIVVIHDHLLERTTDGTGPVAARTAAELRALRLRGPDGALTGEHVPMLDEVLAVVAPSRAGILLEVKGPQRLDVLYERAPGGARAVAGARYEGLEDRVLDALARAGVGERTSVMAFNPDLIARVRALAPAQLTTLLVGHAHVMLVEGRPEDSIAWAARVGAGAAGLQHTLVNEAVMDAARAAGLGVGVWTVNDEAAMRRLAALGVDVITTDRPDLGLRVLGP
ncbi:MAG TPA: glycerophosphodiester phosphodiesterase family protein [Methylomirabilota bacterium]|nr:glycerophosphodiester phosphodiesterase family protein [Methylomirabilota bacterium]